MNFYELFQLLNENTISQELKKAQKEYSKEFVDKIISKAISIIHNALPQNFNLNSKNIMAKWVAYNAIKKSDIAYEKVYPSVRTATYAANTRIENLIYIGVQFLGTVIDYLVSRVDENGNLDPQLSSKFNNPSFTSEQLVDLNDQYHEDLKNKQKTKPGRPGKSVLDFPDGYSWVDLERKYCEIEKDTMGHCGNVGGALDDTILSLRDKKNIPHLTFILNKGILGEMKGRGNDKPSTKYHPYIIELLKLPIIKRVSGGGYLTENNFKLGDLTEEQLQELIKLKPDFENDFIIEKLNNSKEDIDNVLTKEEIFKFLKEARSNIKDNLEETITIAYYTKNPEILNELVEMFYSNVSIMITVAANDYASKEVLEKLVDYENLNVKERVSKNKNVSIEILKQMAEDKDDNVRVAVATSPILRKFFSSPYFRQYSKEAKEILNKLANDEVQLVADTANFALRGSQDPITSARVKGSYKDVIK